MQKRRWYFDGVCRSVASAADTVVSKRVCLVSWRLLHRPCRVALRATPRRNLGQGKRMEEQDGMTRS